MSPLEFFATANWIFTIKYTIALMLIGLIWGAWTGSKEGFVGALAYSGFGMLIGLSAGLMATICSLGIGFIILV